MNDLNFKKDLEIDEYALEFEWKRQAQLYAAWSQESVNAAYEYDRAKEQLDLIRAQLDQAIRQNPGMYGVEKITEGAVQSAILMSAKYQVHNNAQLEAKKRWKTLEIARDAFDHKKKALENLTQLFLKNYYAEPYVAGNAKKAIEDNDRQAIQKSLDDSMRDRKLKRRE